MDGKGNFLGVYQFDAKAALTGYELLGKENGMFVQTTKHLHGQINPLEGTQEQILGSLRVLTDQLTPDQLANLGLARVEFDVSAASGKANGHGREPAADVQAVPEAGVVS